MKKAFIHTDGAARGNPGPAAIGATIRDEKGNLQATVSRRIGVTTNNQAEYRAIIAALEKAADMGISEVDLKSDSELVVKQLKGQYRVKNAALKPVYEKAQKLIERLAGFRISHIPRARNAEADALANQALDS